MKGLEGIESIHIIGIGGISNSAIARLLLSKGYKVTGSDMKSSDTIKELEKIGIRVSIGHSESNIKSPDLVSYTAAISEDNPEMVKARFLGIPIMSRTELLGHIMNNYKDSICVAGTHGKTSTTSMITHVLLGKNDPTALVGGVLNGLESNLVVGKSEIFVTEACEYKDSFLMLNPNIGVILNVDEDHLDYFNGIDGIINSFKKFADGTKGMIIYNFDDYNTNIVVSDYEDRKISFGQMPNADYSIKNIIYDENGNPTFDICFNDELEQRISLIVPGYHNILNAVAAYVSCKMIFDEPKYIADRLASFKNAHRRFDVYGEFNGVLIVDDYSHHPREIIAAIDSAKRISGINRIIVVFQPHTFSRTKEFLDIFGSSFSGVDYLIVSDIYAAREEDTGEVSSEDIVKSARDYGIDAVYGEGLEKSADLAVDYSATGDLIITMGAGDIDRAARIIKFRLSEEKE